MSASPYKQLEQEFKRLHAFRGALSLLRWDAAVMMPRGSADVRGDQLAALETEHHALLTAPRITRLLDRAQANCQGLEDWQVANLREMRRQRDHAIATPVSLDLAPRPRPPRAPRRAGSRRAQQGKFAAVRAASRRGRAPGARQGGAAGPGAEPRALRCAGGRVQPRAHAPPTSMRCSRRCRGGCPSLIREAIARAGAAARCCRCSGKFPAGKQRALVVEVMKAMGFPFDRGRLDESEHPFTEGVPGRHPHHHALRSGRRVLGPAGRAARDRACDVRPRPAAGLARPAGRARPRHGARGEPVAADGDDHLPQPPVRALPAAAAREALRRQRPRVGASRTSTATSRACGAA